MFVCVCAFVATEISTRASLLSLWFTDVANTVFRTSVTPSPSRPCNIVGRIHTVFFVSGRPERVFGHRLNTSLDTVRMKSVDMHILRLAAEAVNLDTWTETFNMNFYFSYLTCWPECCAVAEAIDGSIAGYIIGKVEGSGHELLGSASLQYDRVSCNVLGRLEDTGSCCAEVARPRLGYLCRTRVSPDRRCSTSVTAQNHNFNHASPDKRRRLCKACSLCLD